MLFSVTPIRRKFTPRHRCERDCLYGRKEFLWDEREEEPATFHPLDPLTSVGFRVLLNDLHFLK
jgi:hypothetical protein